LHYQTCSDSLCGKIQESVVANTLQSSTNLLQQLQEKIHKVPKELHTETAKLLGVKIMTNSFGFSSKFNLNSHIERRLKMPANAVYPSQKLFEEFQKLNSELLLKDQENLLDTSFAKISENNQELEDLLIRRAELFFRCNQIKDEINKAKILGQKLDTVNNLLTGQL